MPNYTTVTRADQVTPTIIEIVEAVIDGWYNEGPIDWVDVWDRVDGTELPDGTVLDMGDDVVSPAINKIKRIVRAHRADG